jgi:capsular polysaccharide transport system ATP-binding protein
MIRVSDVVKEYVADEGRHRVLDGISFSIAKGEKMAVLGRNGAGKSTLVKLLGGVETPTSGRIDLGMSLSWPLGFHGGIHPNLTGVDNVRFLARLYERSFDELYAFTEEFAELGEHMRMPIATYSTGMRTRIAFGLSLAINFDCYLIDEVLSVGDPKFQRKCREELLEKRKGNAMILVSHDVHLIREFCTHALVLKQGRGKVFSDLDFAISIYEGL